MNGENRNNKFSWSLLCGLLAAYLAIFFLYYPPTLGIEDEAGYINQAFVWLRGSISAEGAGYENLAVFEEYRGRNVSWCSPGRSAAILPFWILFGTGGIFVSGAAIHLLAVLLGAWLLQRLNLSPLWAVLILFHPTLALYSRTVMSDELAGTLFLAAVLATTFRRENGILTGILTGLAAFTRPHAALIAPFFAFSLWRKKGFRAAFFYLLAAGIFAVLIVAYNLFIFGAIGGRPVYATVFSPKYVPENLGFYLPALFLIYPLMLVAPFLDKSEIGNQVRAVCLPTLGLLLFYFFHETGSNFAQTAILGQRLLQTALPVWIVSYAVLLDNFGKKYLREKLAPVLRRAAIAAVCVLLLTGQLLIFRQHQAHLLNYRLAQDEIARIVPPGSFVIANRNLTKLIGTPATGAPVYRWRVYQFLNVAYDHSAEISGEANVWYLAILPKAPGDELPDVLRDYIRRYKMQKIETANPNLILYRANAGQN